MPNEMLPSILQAVKLIFHKFNTYNLNDYLKVYDKSGSDLIAGRIYGNQDNRESVIIHDDGAYLFFNTDSGSHSTGFQIEFQCYSLTPNGTHRIPWFIANQCRSC